ncbi:MAG: hypothetical protein GY855_09590, partial [candidate division Zixibacteria bacterium]|nr:hypothetical protein [candidate division Zixibacteria bacterium]
MKKSCYYILGIMIFSLLFISSTAGQIIENEETELTLQERIEHLGLNISEETKKRFEKINQLPAPPLILTDDEWDWREMDGVTAVKNQRSCGSCWAHSVIAAFESQLLIYDGVEWDLSEQQVVDCNDFNSSCAGGDPAGACRFIIEYGLVEEECYPYINRDGECYQESCDVMAIADDYRDIPNNINAIKNSLLYSPISSCFRVYDDLTYDCYWHDYNDATNHSVEIVGWDDNMCGGTGAWIFKNSWGNWGDSGYGYLPYGSCGIGNYSQQPIHYAQSAELSVNPDTLIFYVPSGGEDSRVLQIGNTGYRDLFYRFQLLKSSFQDSYGYYWFDSDDIYGPEYDWIDITQIGDIIEFPGPDPNMSNTGHIDFGFDFEYYGETYSSICICSNGWASFTDSTTVTAISKHFPLPGSPNAMMTPYWTNLYPGMGGNVYFYTNNSD